MDEFNTKQDECSEERLSYIFYYPKGKYVFNRSVDLASQPYKKYYCALKELGDNTLQSKYKDIVDKQMSMDFLYFELLEVVPVENRNNRDQSILNEKKQYWCEEKHAVWNVSDKSIDVEADKIIQRNVIIALDEILGGLAAVLYPFVKKEYVSDVDDRVKRYFRQRCEVRRYRNIDNYKHDIDNLNRVYIDLADRKDDISAEMERLKVEKQLLEDEIHKLHEENPSLPDEYISDELLIPNKNIYLTSKQVYCIIAALTRGYGVAYKFIHQSWLPNIRVKDDPQYTSDSNIKTLCNNSGKFTLNSIKSGCNIINELKARGYIDVL